MIIIIVSDMLIQNTSSACTDTTWSRHIFDILVNTSVCYDKYQITTPDTNLNYFNPTFRKKNISRDSQSTQESSLWSIRTLYSFSYSRVICHSTPKSPPSNLIQHANEHRKWRQIRATFSRQTVFFAIVVAAIKINKFNFSSENERKESHGSEHSPSCLSFSLLLSLSTFKSKFVNFSFVLISTTTDLCVRQPASENVLTLFLFLSSFCAQLGCFLRLMTPRNVHFNWISVSLTQFHINKRRRSREENSKTV